MNKSSSQNENLDASNLNEGGVEMGSGNVFLDLGLPDADERQIKVRLAVRILSTIEARGLTQAQAAELVGLKQPDISALRRARLEGFSIDRLLRVLRRLGHTVHLQVSEQTSEDAHLLVVA